MMREMKAKVGNVGAKTKMCWHACLQTILCYLQRVKKNFKEWWTSFIVYVRKEN